MKRELTREEVVANIRTHPPGSTEAHAAGCTCPAAENEHGAGWCGLGMENGWYVVSSSCPLHWHWEKDLRAPHYYD